MHYLNEPATLEGSVSGSQTFFTDNLYLPDTWFYTVTAITSFGKGPPSNEVCYSYPTYSDTVMDLWAQVQGYTIVLEWSSPDTNGTYGNISSYQIFRGTAAGQEKLLYNYERYSNRICGYECNSRYYLLLFGCSVELIRRRYTWN